MKPAGRYIEIYQDEELEWRYRVWGANHQDIVSDSSQGYVHRNEAAGMAASLHPTLAILEVAVEEKTPRPGEADAP